MAQASRLESALELLPPLYSTIGYICFTNLHSSASSGWWSASLSSVTPLTFGVFCLKVAPQHIMVEAKFTMGDSNSA